LSASLPDVAANHNAGIGMVVHKIVMRMILTLLFEMHVLILPSFLPSSLEEMVRLPYDAIQNI